jgi:hypothetical protein
MLPRQHGYKYVNGLDQEDQPLTRDDGDVVISLATCDHLSHDTEMVCRRTDVLSNSYD